MTDAPLVEARWDAARAACPEVIGLSTRGGGHAAPYRAKYLGALPEGRGRFFLKLRELDLENPGNDELGRQKYQFFASDGVERFNAFAHSVLPEQISDTKQVQIENY